MDLSFVDIWQDDGIQKVIEGGQQDEKSMVRKRIETVGG